MLHGVQWSAAGAPRLDDRSTALATPNYSYEKRQRELAKKRKAEEKRQKKQGRTGDIPDNGPPAEPADAGATSPAAPPPSGD